MQAAAQIIHLSQGTTHLYNMMKNAAFALTIHMVSSLDGFIAKKDNSIAWFNTSCSYENGAEAENPEEFLRSIDCYIMGSRTYELAEALAKDYGWAYGDKATVVVTKRNIASSRSNVEFYSGDLTTLVNEKLKSKYTSVWAVGGSELTKSLLQQNLVNEIRVSVLPIILGEGLPYFDHIGQEQVLQLRDAKAYKNGMVELCYRVQD